MSPDAIFTFGNSFVLIGWLLLIVVPKWKHTQTIVIMCVVSVLAVCYTFLILKDIQNFNADSFSTLANVKALFESDGAVAAGWLHYLTFDLFIGAYIVKKSIGLGLSRWVYTLILPFSFIFAPIGLLIFLIVKTVKTKKFSEAD